MKMICKQEGIAEVTREALNKIQLAKLNAVLKREQKNERDSLQESAGKTGKSGCFENISVYDRVGAGEKQWKDASVFTGRSPESNLQNRRVEQPVPVNVYFTQKETVNIR